MQDLAELVTELRLSEDSHRDIEPKALDISCGREYQNTEVPHLGYGNRCGRAGRVLNPYRPDRGCSPAVLPAAGVWC